MSIGNNIKTIRQSKGIKAKELANKIGVSASMLSQWENDKKPPVKFETVEKIAAALGVTVYDIYPLEVYEFEDIANNELLKNFYKLNENGKKEAIKRVYELTQIDEYTQPPWEIDKDGRIKVR